MENIESLPVHHNQARQRFEIWVGDRLAELTYGLYGDMIVFTHTGVPPELEGQGIASRLAKAGLEHARANGLSVKSQCRFVSLYLRRHPEYQDLTH